MKSALCSNQSGSALIAIMIVIIVIAVLVYGSVFFFKNDANVHSPSGAIKALDQAKKDIERINQ
ncbi:MAG: hypothetical protein U9Q85_02685 [Patescibacteria group bacterium]|nr:hypothetical protein [Patescibacteria group bacterium]